MIENRAARYFCYAASAIIGSEILFYGLRYAHGVWKSSRVPTKTTVGEVLWTNELSDTCIHADESSDEQRDDSNGKQMKRSNMLKCENPYCSVKNMERMIEIIDSARYSIDLAMYSLSSRKIARAFKQAAERGVSIRIITDKEMLGAAGSQIRNLSNQGILNRVPDRSDALMHHKFCIIDGPKRSRLAYSNCDIDVAEGLLMTGSLNWTKNGFCKNWENILIISNHGVIEHYEAEFERLYQTFQKKTDLKVVGL